LLVALNAALDGLSPEVLARLAFWAEAPGQGPPASLGAASDEELAALRTRGLVDEGPSLRFAGTGAEAYARLDEPRCRDVHSALGDALADRGAAAEHLLAAGRTAEAVGVAVEAAEASTDALQIASLLELAAGNADPGASRDELAVRAARAALAVGRFDVALGMSELVAPGRGVATVAAAALAGLGRHDDARCRLEIDAPGDPDGAGHQLAQLLLWPYVDLRGSRGCAPTSPALELAAHIVTGRPAPAPLPDGEPLATGVALALAGELDAARDRLGAGTEAEESGLTGARQRALLAASSSLLDALATGACVAAEPILARMSRNEVVAGDRPVFLAAHAVALGDTGATGEALAELASLDAARLPKGHSAAVNWARSEIELVAGGRAAPPGPRARSRRRCLRAFRWPLWRPACARGRRSTPTIS
jgi:hypothetical protein